MSFRSTMTMLLASVLHLTSGPVCAGSEEAGAVLQVPPFGNLSTWFTRVPDERMPIEYRALREPGNHALIPPRSNRDGLEPRLAATLEYNDNLLLTPSKMQQGTALIVAPGMNWLEHGARHSIEIDASVEAIQGSGNYENIGYKTLNAATLQVIASAQPLARASVDYAGNLLYSQEAPGETLLAPSLSNQLFAVYYQRHQIATGWRADATTEIGARWIGSWASSDNPEFVRTRAQDLELSARTRPSANQRFGLTFRQRSATFAGQPAVRFDSPWLEWEQQWSSTLLTQAAIAPTRGTGGEQLLLWRASLTQTFSDGQWNAAAGYDVNPAGGNGLMYGVHNASLGASWRLLENARLDIALQASRYVPLSGGDTINTLNPLISFSLPLEARWWLNIRYQGIAQEVPAQDFKVFGNRLMATLVRSF